MMVLTDCLVIHLIVRCKQLCENVMGWSERIFWCGVNLNGKNAKVQPRVNWLKFDPNVNGVVGCFYCCLLPV